MKQQHSTPTKVSELLSLTLHSFEEVAEPPQDSNQETDIFGKWFAGEERFLPEPNTVLEREVISALIKHYRDNNNSDLETYAQLIKKLAKEGRYTKFLAPPPDKRYVWRVLGFLTPYELLILLGHDKVTNEDEVKESAQKPEQQA